MQPYILSASHVIPRVAVVGVRTVQAGVRVAVRSRQQRHLSHRRAPSVLVALVRQPAGALNKFAGVARKRYRAGALPFRSIAGPSTCVEINQCVGRTDNSLLSHFSATTWPRWLSRRRVDGVEVMIEPRRVATIFEFPLSLAPEQTSSTSWPTLSSEG